MKLQHMEADAEQRAQHNEAMLNRLAAIELALLRSSRNAARWKRELEQLIARESTTGDDAPKGNAPHAGPDG